MTLKKSFPTKLKNTYQFLFKKHQKKTLGVLILLLLAYWFCLPHPLFKDPYCLVLEDHSGALLGARIASDGQWRFPEGDSVPQKFIQALIEFEDRRFYQHPGVDPVGLARAINQNIKNGAIVSGGSTISMQTIRMARKPKQRNLYHKLIEMMLATRLEIGYSKSEILKLYSAHAPFGGNVVGLEAASWRYFGKSPHLLSWAEAAMLAVLPNSPALIHPGRNRTALYNKRNRLLDRLQAKGVLDSLTCQLAKEEGLPEKPHPLPQLAPHLLDRVGTEGNGRIRSTLEKELQIQANALLSRHQGVLSRREIHNLACVIIDIESGAVLAYVGNVIGAGVAHSEAVDIIKAPRSTGSILKPILYAKMLQEGSILPQSLISDIPMQLIDYRPENFNRKYDGLVSARKALIRSLNIPMVAMLQSYGLEKFHYELQALNLKTINQSAGHYGLPLILGGAEVNLLEITNTYACMARTLNHFQPLNSLYNKNDFRPAHFIQPSLDIEETSILLAEAPRISAAAIWMTLEAMQKVERPNSVGEWEFFQSSQQIAWKTGTSFGFRDAWAIGLNSKYAIGVWAGNADGEGRPGLIGVKAAAPVLFDLFQYLPTSSPWFIPPYDDMIQLPVCSQSGYRASSICPKDTIWAPANAYQVKTCSHHQLLHLDASGQWQVNSACEAQNKIQHVPWFVVPPVEEYYYRTRSPNYQPLPPWRADCLAPLDPSKTAAMQLIYPSTNTKIYVPVDLNGKLSRTVFTLAHRNPEAIVHWHVDNEYIGSTSNFHNLELLPEAGSHLLVLVDEAGNRLERKFEIIAK